MSRSHELWTEAVTGMDEILEIQRVDWSRLSRGFEDIWTRQREVTAEGDAPAKFECFIEDYPEPGQRLKLAEAEGLVHQSFKLHASESAPREGLFRPRKGDFEPTEVSYSIKSTVEVLRQPDLLSADNWNEIDDEQIEKLTLFTESQLSLSDSGEDVNFAEEREYGPLDQPIDEIVLTQFLEERSIGTSARSRMPFLKSERVPIDSEEGLNVLEDSIASIRISLDGLRSGLGKSA